MIDASKEATSLIGSYTMTIDERLEAITQTLELTILENRDRDAAWEKRQLALDQMLDKRFTFIGESLEKLANVA